MHSVCKRIQQENTARDACGVPKVCMEFGYKMGKVCKTHTHWPKQGKQDQSRPKLEIETQ